MPLQQIKVTPFNINSEENEDSFNEERKSVGASNTQGVYASDSQSSTRTSSSVELCRICHCEGDSEDCLISPCYCSGTLRFVHQNCLQQWIKSSSIRCCELCKFQFIMHTKTKPFLQWEALEMSEFERKKLFCAVLFHIIAIICVVWTLYVLINGTAEEMNEGIFDWSFWAKVFIVAIAFIGGAFFMYVQCKSYLQICQRWKAYNKVIYVQNIPEKQPLTSEVAHSSKSSTSHCNLSKSPRTLEDTGNFNETFINMKGDYNSHFFYNDECRIYFQNEDREIEESMVGLPPLLKLCRALGLT